MSEHTPEPWTTDEDEHDAPYQDIKIKAGYRTICTVWIDDAPVHDYNAEQRANARILKAAPNLLAAGVELAAAEAAYRLAYETHGDGNLTTGYAWDRLRKAGDRMRAAIAKAKGDRPTPPPEMVGPLSLEKKS